MYIPVMATLPLLVALLLLAVASDFAQRTLLAARAFLERNARTIAAVIVVLLALALLRNGIAGLTS